MHPTPARLLRLAQQAKQRWLSSFEQPRAFQRDLLASFVTANVDTAFGREHAFASITDEDDFRRLVPPRTYDQLAPWIERAAAGERGVLTAEQPYAFNRTSGSTSAAKLIPVLQSFDAGPMNQRHFVGLDTILESHLEILDRPDTTLSFPFTRILASATKTAGGIVYSAASNRPKAVQFANDDRRGWPGGPFTPWGQVPPAVQTLVELDYYRARASIEHDLLALFTLNPSTLVVFAQHLAQSVPRLLAELRAGTILGEAGGPPNPQRAAALEAIVREHGTLRPRDVWPNLRLIWSWKAASCALYLPTVSELFGPKVDIMPWPTVSSEVSISVPVDHDDDAPLALPMAFFELLPPDEEPSATSRTLLCGEVTVGNEYQIIATQMSGLYRYVTDDVVRVTGWQDGKAGGVPRVEFVRRRGANSSFTGEKLTEHQVLQALQATLAKCRVRATNSTCCPVWSDPPYYALAIEPAAPIGEDDQARLAIAFDEALGVVNDEYPSKRASGRLGPVRVHVLEPGAFARYNQLRVERGEPASQMKDRTLQRDASALQALLGPARQP